MATSRFDKFLQSDYSMNYYQPQLFTPNFEMLGKVIGQLDQEKQTFDALSDLPIDYYQGVGHEEYVKKLRDKIDSKKEEVSQAFASGDLSLARSKMSGAISTIKKEWMPGGTADLLAKAKKDLIAQEAKLGEVVKNEKNRKWAWDATLESTRSLAKLGDIRMGSSDIIEYQDYTKDAIDIVDKIKKSSINGLDEAYKTAEELGLKNLPSEVIVEIQKKGVTKEVIANITESLLRSPKYANQLKVENYYAYNWKDNLDDETANKHIPVINQVLAERYASNIAAQEANYKKIRADYENSGASQATLNSIDDAAKQARAAIDSNYKSSLITDRSQIPNFYNNETIRSVKAVTTPLAYEETDPKLYWQKFQAAEKRRNLASWKELLELPEPGAVSQDVTVIDDQKDLVSTYEVSSKEFGDAAKNVGNLTTSLGINRGNENDRLNGLKGLVLAQKEATRLGENFITHLIAKKGNYGLGDYTAEELNKMGTEYRNVSGKVPEVIDSYETKKDELDDVTSVVNSVISANKDNPDFKNYLNKARESYNSQYNKNVSEEDFWKMYLRGDLDKIPVAKTWTNATSFGEKVKLIGTTFWNFLTTSPKQTAPNQMSFAGSSNMGDLIRDAYNSVAIDPKAQTKKIVKAVSSKESDDILDRVKELYNNANPRTLKDLDGKPVVYRDKEGTVLADPDLEVVSVNFTTDGELVTVKNSAGKLGQALAQFNPNNKDSYLNLIKSMIATELTNNNTANVDRYLSAIKKIDPAFSKLGETIREAIPQEYQGQEVYYPTSTGHVSAGNSSVKLAKESNGVRIITNDQAKYFYVAKIGNNYNIVTADPTQKKGTSNQAKYGKVLIIPFAYDLDNNFDPSKATINFKTAREAANALIFMKLLSEKAFTGTKKTGKYQKQMSTSMMAAEMMSGIND